MSDYFYLCGACGHVGEATSYRALQRDVDTGHLRPNVPGESDPILECPHCRHRHADGDGGPGLWDGTLRTITRERAEHETYLGEDWAERNAQIAEALASGGRGAQVASYKAGWEDAIKAATKFLLAANLPGRITEDEIELKWLQPAIALRYLATQVPDLDPERIFFRELACSGCRAKTLFMTTDGPREGMWRCLGCGREVNIAAVVEPEEGEWRTATPAPWVDIPVDEDGVVRLSVDPAFPGPPDPDSDMPF